ncbi:MAG: helix-turn-helix domain-containing protein [Chloroflexi bacterium]|nr:helix-turn-helix domain-containing protein [Chloroflexota bacterium]
MLAAARNALIATHTYDERPREVGIDGGHSQVISAGDTVLWLAGATQDFGNRDEAAPWELIWTHFHPRDQWHDWLAWPLLGRGVAWIPAPPDRLRGRIEDALIEMDTYARSAFPQASEFALNALERALLWLEAANPEPAARIHESVQEAILFISRHLDQRVSVRQVADAVHLSPSRIAHLFKQQIGISPARFIEQRRMERAQALLESSSLPIRAVSAATGFSSQFYFASRFRTYVGTSPSAWRRRGRSPQ